MVHKKSMATQASMRRWNFLTGEAVAKWRLIDLKVIATLARSYWHKHSNRMW